MSTSFPRLLRSLGFWSLAALIMGLILGVYGHETGSAAVGLLARAVHPFGAIWMNALQLVVLPLVVLQLLSAVTANGGASVGSAGVRAVVGLSLVYLILMALSLGLVSQIVGLYSVTPETVEAIRTSVSIPAGAQAAAGRAATTVGEWLVALVPTNLVEAFANGQLIQILVVTVVFGLAVNRLPDKQRGPFIGLVRTLTDAVMVVIRWILFITPLGVFALVLGLALGTGTEAASVLGTWLLMSQGIQLVFLIALYPVVSFLGRTTMATFAKAVLPVQLIALSTRSSLATIPAQIESGRDQLGFSATSAGFFVPLCVTLFKITTAIVNPIRLLFLAHIFGVALDPGQVVTFMITILLISYTAVGIPSGGAAFRTLPAYVAAGIPVEGLVILQAVKDLQDYGDTVSNATGQFAAATVLSRGDRV